MTTTRRPIWIWIAATIAILFGGMTIKSGGSVLFVDGEARQAAGNYVGFVLWFNFLAGFAYIVAGAGLWMRKRWATKLALLIAIATLCVFTLFGIYILNGGAHEMRTVIAMSLRSTIWIAIAGAAWFFGKATAQ